MAGEYVKLTDIEHVLKRPGMYIGGLEPVPRSEYVFNFETGKLDSAYISTPLALHRIFVEILSNATDNKGRTERDNPDADVGSIDVTMDNYWITVTNGGNPIPLVDHDSGYLVPELIFGHLRSGSNYGDNRNDAGVNGIGAKATNIFSLEFIVECGNADMGLYYKQVWTNNMMKVEEYELTNYDGDSFTRISYHADFERFYQDGYSDEDLVFFAAETLCASYNSNVVVSFNEVVYDLRSNESFKDLLIDPKAKFISYEGEINTKLGDGTIKFIVADTPNDGKELSFVNGMRTRQGGKHVDAVNDNVIDSILKKINDDQLEKAKKMMKKGKLTAAETKSFKIYSKNLVDHLTVIVSVSDVPDPDFVGQTKDKLNNPVIKFKISDELLKPISSWQIMRIIKELIKSKQVISLKKTDGKLAKHVNLNKLTDANQAGKKQRHLCTLAVSEGDSASGYIDDFISLINNGKDYYGNLKLQGKILNVMVADAFQVSESIPISNIKKALGLKEGTDYSDPKEFKNLRYGSLLIMTDADVDGRHITALILLYFHTYFPSLISMGFIKLYRTPILRVYRGKEVIKFFSEAEFYTWKNSLSENEVNKWKFKYYKGLGTSQKSEVRDDLVNSKYVEFIYDDEAEYYMRLAFDKGNENKRKKWIVNYDEMLAPVVEGQETISDLLNIELRSYSFATLTRALPSVIDGFKESIRKLVYGSLELWKNNSNEVKLINLSAFVMEKANYHHGNISMEKMAIKMAQSYTGANNLPLLIGVGQYGTRIEAGKNCSAARYLFIKPSNLLKYIFHKEDKPLLVDKIEDGIKVEPENYYPIVPLHIINGVIGIATGFSTDIPPHDPLDVIDWYENRLNGVNLFPPEPRYVNYKGIIGPIIYQDEDGNIFDDELPSKYYCLGDFHLEKNKVVITELPIKTSPSSYAAKLKSLIEEKKIKDFRDLSTGNNVYFEIEGWEEKASVDTLGLSSTISMTNIVCLDKYGRPTLYPTIHDIFEEFYEIRLEKYHERKLYKLDKLKEDILKLEQEIKFITLVLDGSIKVLKVSKNVIYDSMKHYNLPNDIYTRVKLSRCSQDEIDDAEKLIKEKLKEIKRLEDTRPEDIWLDDLDTLKQEYIKWRKQQDKKDAKNNKIVKTVEKV